MRTAHDPERPIIPGVGDRVSPGGLGRLWRRPSPSMLVALVALLVALEGPALASGVAHVARLINGSEIKANTVTTKQIKDHTVKTRDLNAGVFRGLATLSQSDLRFVNALPGSADEAPNSAALGGKDASAFYDRAESDGRFVAKQSGSADQAPDSAALAGHPAADYALKGTDVTGPLNLDAGAVPAHSCATLDAAVGGAQVGDLPVMAFTGGSPAPPGLVFEALKVAAPDHLTMRICNPTASPSVATAPGVAVRVITLR